MNIFGIGFPELLFIFVIALIVLGPRNLVKTSQQLSSAIRRFVTSDTWKSIVHSTKEIRDIQGKIIEDTGLQDSINTLRNSTRDLVNPSIAKWILVPKIPRNTEESNRLNRLPVTIPHGIPESPDQNNPPPEQNLKTEPSACPLNH